MDLSGLSSNLPPTRPITQTSIDDLNRELTNEFKNAAKSVAALYNSTSSAPVNPSNEPTTRQNKAEFAKAAKSVTALYRLTNNSNTLVRQKGYLDCLDDMLQVLTNGEDVENWVLARRAEVLKETDTVHYGAVSTAAQGPSASAPVTAAAPLTASTTTTNTTTSPGNNVLPNLDSEDFHLPLDYEFSFALDVSPHYHFRPSFAPLSVLHSHKQRALHSRQLARKLRGVSSQDSHSSSEESDRDKDREEEKREENMKKRRKLEEREERRKTKSDD